MGGKKEEKMSITYIFIKLSIEIKSKPSQESEPDGSVEGNFRAGHD